MPGADRPELGLPHQPTNTVSNEYNEQCACQGGEKKGMIIREHLFLAPCVCAAGGEGMVYTSVSQQPTEHARRVRMFQICH